MSEVWSYHSNLRMQCLSWGLDMTAAQDKQRAAMRLVPYQVYQINDGRKVRVRAYSWKHAEELASAIWGCKPAVTYAYRVSVLRRDGAL